MREKNISVIIFLGFVIIVIGLSFLSENLNKKSGITGNVIGSECSGKYPLFYLSSQTNAHASSTSSSVYDIPVCLSELTSNPNGGGIGLYLSSQTNAHAYTNPALLSAPFPIYVGQYVCQVYDVSGSCPLGTECLVTLSSENNAHLAGCGTGAYSKTLCCSPPATSCVETNWVNTGEYQCDEDTGIRQQKQTKIICVSGEEETAEQWVDNDCEIGYYCSEGNCISLCGNGLIDTDGSYIEECDFNGTGTAVFNTNNDTCEEVNSIFTGGDLSCFDCHFNTDNCLSSQSCELNDATWENAAGNEINSIIEGNNVYLNVIGENCGGKTITAEIYENNWVNDEYVTEKTFIYGSRGTWITEWIDEGGLDPNPEYIFIASTSDGDIESDELEVTPGYTWKYDSFGQCSEECDGIQTRNVWCERSDGESVSDSHCSGNKPAEEQDCGVCESDEICEKNVCVYDVNNQCDNECILNQKQCGDEDEKYQICKYDNDGCLVWGDFTDCDSDETCINGECILETYADFCKDLTTQETCESADSDIAKKSIETIKNIKGFCDGNYYLDSNCKVINCVCYWDGSNCNSKFEVDCNNGGGTNKYCTYSETKWEDYCNEDPGYISASWNAFWYENYIPITDESSIPAYCKDLETQIPCTVITKLPFFTWFNFIIVISLIMIYYFLKRK